MALGPARFTAVGETEHAHEQEGIAFVRDALPNSDPYHAWALFELADPTSGRLLEVDMLVVGYGALYLLELKGYSGRISGDSTDWWWEPRDGGRKRWREPPVRLANHKAKVLKSRLRQIIRDERAIPFVQALVFLSSDELVTDLRADGRSMVVTRAELRDAILKHQFPGAQPTWQNRRLDQPQILAVARALDKLGIRARKGKTLAGDYELRELEGDGPGYQDRRAVHTANPRLAARARTYLVPQQTSVERRQQLRRAADRESQLLYEVREHPHILSWQGYVPDAPLGPTVLFDEFEGGQPLPAFLRSSNVSFDERVTILEQVSRALAYCHRREVVHGALSPEAVLVRRPPAATTGVDTRLISFQLGRGQDVESTSHWSDLASSPWALYQAPEVREGGERDARADLYSLGSLAYYLFTERHPADTVFELHRKLERDRYLDVRVVDAQVPDAVAEAIDLATQTRLASRVDDVTEWIQYLLDRLTEPNLTDAAPEVDPLLAVRGDLLGDLRVEKVLGAGATAKVLHVIRETDARELALKVSLEPDHDDRLRAEADAVRSLHHARIVQCHEVLSFSGRTCLLLGLAGSQTLKRLLEQEGTVSLDFASRYGQDLLSALEHLEERLVLHRDIKPANLGVGAAGKTAHHLTLFDFSLAHTSRSELSVGTSVYRDPFLASRGAWDAAADRWSAAITLHEMLTGVRPGYEAALDPDAPLMLKAERFDASARDALVAFFEKALHRHVERRFGTAEEMSHAWYRVFEAPADERTPHERTPHDRQPHERGPHEGQGAAAAASNEEELTDEELRAIAPSTPVMALPLSYRARNALDRAGLLTAADLASLPENRLSAVRGVGTKVARDILELRRRWTALHRVPADGDLAAQAAHALFAADYAGEDVLVTTVGLDPPLAEALLDAGLRTLGALARAPRTHVEAIAARVGASATTLRELLSRESSRKNERGLPRSVEALVDELLSPKAKRAATVRLLYGLAAPFEGRLDVGAKEVAAHLSMTRANVYLSIDALRDKTWADHGALTELESLAESIVSRAGGAMPLSRAAGELLGRVPHDPAAAPELTRARAAALLRIVTEVQKAEVDGLRSARLGRGEPWLLASQDATQVLRRLGQAADAFADRDVLASPGEVQRQLESIARGSPLEGAPPAQLADWAASASERAACSALMEIYPRGMPPERALELSATLLQSAARAKRGADPRRSADAHRAADPHRAAEQAKRADHGLRVDELASKVAARYPEAAPLPARPELDKLLVELRFEWDPSLERYTRPEEDEGTSLGTSIDRSTRPSVSRHPRPPEPELDLDLAGFDRALRIAIEQRAFRAIAVNPAYASEATRALEERLQLRAAPLDAMLLAAMRDVMREKNVAPAVVHQADREGPRGKTWPRLTQLARLAEERLIRTLTAPPDNTPPSPLLLTRPGLLARYGLSDLLRALVARAAEDDAEAILLLVPCHDYGGAPRIEDRLPIPGILITHALRVPRALVEADATEAA